MLRAVAALCCILVAFGRPLADDLATFADFRETYGRQYSTLEESTRFSCFQKNLDTIDALNSANDAAVYGINKFSDWCESEMQTLRGFAAPSNKTFNYARRYSSDEMRAAPAAIDYRKQGYVTPVKNQAQCGSCWAFSATGCMEGSNFAATKKLVSLSEEELVQCVDGGKCNCQVGGLMDDGFKFAISNGIDSEADYPYTSGGGVQGKCNTQKEKKSVASFKSFEDIAHDEDQMATYLAAHGPIAIAVKADTWMSYQGGVMKSCPADQPDHGVLLVGYGSDSTGSWWIIKNSWGASWGESGYIRLARGKNLCNINSYPSYVKA